MSKIIDNKSLSYEKERLDEVLQKIDLAFEKRKLDQIRLQSEISYLQAHFNGDNFQNDIDLAVNQALLDTASKILTGLTLSSQKPYFARIDFKEEGEPSHSSIYIGKMNFIEKPGDHPLIVDWRAPVSNLYYESRLGQTGYECPEGYIQGDLSLKRQFVINKRILEKFYDIDLTTNDELLQNAITANTDRKLKDIAATIQAEQNRIIRSDMWIPIIVQGAAGSGKTTAALHRMAYMIYNYGEKFEPDQFIIIGPNKFFLDYISEVLPELGVSRVTQSTYEETAMKFLGKKLKLQDKNNILENYEKDDDIKKQKRFKASLKYRDLIKDFLDDKTGSLLPAGDLNIDKFTIINSEKISWLFHSYLNYLPPYKRIPLIKDHVRQLAKSVIQSVSEQLEIQCNNNVLTAKREIFDPKLRQSRIIKELDYRDKTIEYLKKNHRALVNKFFDRIVKTSCWQYYDQFLNYIVNNFEGIVKRTAETTLKSIKEGVYELDDLAPLMFIKRYMYGSEDHTKIKHIIIDEAQDLSLFQLYVLKMTSPNSSFTILGDICQGIYSYRGVSDWSALTEIFTTNHGCKYEILNQSYRNTVEVMTEAVKVLAKFPAYKNYLAKPVIRHGNKPCWRKAQTTEDICNIIYEIVSGYYENDKKSVAIICKNIKACKKIYDTLKKKKNISFTLITGNEAEYKGGPVIIPIYLAKGLEFDSVIIADADHNTYHMNEDDAKLLYVAMTRPIYDLHLLFIDRPTPLLT